MRERLYEGLDKLNLIGAIGETIKHHRQEIERLQSLSEIREQHGIAAPEGYIFIVETWSNEFEISEHHGKVGYGGESGWYSPTKRKFEGQGSRLDIFVANAIETVLLGLYNPDEPAAVYAYSPDGQVRCKVSGSQYMIDLVPLDHISGQTVNDRLLAESR
ncbi:MAG TPA: hypothetical protein VJJ78_03290 [Candidatus Saccharimonadales bacterium]|nr:hypothetical protein [Candidatus Saccharimonadales bacterium]